MITIIAEIGVNWDGEFGIAEDMIRTAKQIGCDLVKFQSIDGKELFHPEKDRIMKASIDNNNIEKIDKIARDVGIEWFCTPMYPEAVQILNPYVKRFKIRELDGRNLFQNQTNELVSKILETKKEIIASTQISPDLSRYNLEKNIKWLYCVPKYPCSLEDIDFHNLNQFDGFSNHCIESIAPITAAVLGAKIIEVHMTSDKSKDFIDNNVSLDYSEFENLVKQIRLVEKIKK